MSAAESLIVARKSKKGVNYRPDEDKALCVAWIAVSSDSSVGTNQTAEVFYGKFKDVFEANLKGEGLFICERAWTSLSSRFQTISHDVSKFIGCYEQIQVLDQSGTTDDDKKRDALDLFISQYKSGFKYISCWYILRESVKWGAWRSSNSKRSTPTAKRSRSAVENPAVVSVQSENHVENANDTSDDDSKVKRPKGMRKAKMEKISLSLQARQVQAAEALAASSKERVKVAQEQIELNLFSIVPNPGDDMARQYLELRKMKALARIRTEMGIPGMQNSSQQEDPNEELNLI